MRKTCPHCHESVRAEARKCQFCGFRFDVPPPATWPRTLAALAMFPVGVAGSMFILALLGMAAPAITAVATSALATGVVMLAIGTRARSQQRLRVVRACVARHCPTCSG
jgi:hypothetical protein